nr:IS607 family element RNA-guided endonuclease TnpB [Kibdelosporangium sp. MJ126-NF4]CEL21474.1 Mobile element protein [Kibdelosporangium sp. MJ126-NF4]CTQ95959.1 Mobile element protein [Kibdelosporangium sp. MJ126-NF4]
MAAYRFALDPTRGQERALLSHCGAARFAYNWAVSWVRAAWEQRAAEASYGIPEPQLTPWRPRSIAGLRKVWNQVKHDLAPWWDENSKESYNTGLAGAAAAFDNYTASRNGSRAGPTMGKPKRKRKHTAARSCRFTTGTIRLEPDRHHVTLPRLGTLKTHESTRKLARRIEAATARVLSATVSLRSGRWFVAFQVELQRDDPAPHRPDAVIGVDLGITHLAVLSEPVAGVSDEHGFIANPRHFDAASTRLRRACRRVSRRRGPDRRSRQKPSNRWRRANAKRNRLSYRVANLRADGLHKLTTALARHAATVVVENLNVAGMLKNKRLARKIADAGWGKLRRLLGYKTRWRGSVLHVADRWFPSSKTCSACGVVKTKLPLRVRVFRCNACGMVLDRDLNAARNLAKLVAELRESGTGVAGHPQPSGCNGRGADSKTRPSLAGGRETSTPQRLGV